MNAASVDSRPANKPPFMLIGLLLACLLAIGVVVYLVFRSPQAAPEIIHEEVTFESAAEAEINVGQVIDLRETPDVTAEEGQRYIAVIEDRSSTGADGIARIGGLVTFVPNSETGDLVVMDLVSIRGRVAHAVVVEKLDSGVAVPGRPRAETRPRRTESSPDARPQRTMPFAVGDEFDVEITERDRNNPEIDGVTRIQGVVTFVPGTQPGDNVRVRILETRRTIANAIVIPN
jgi:predicted RNA-binding protein with TRAM domain